MSVGQVGAERIRELSGGRLDHGVEVRINRAVVEHDVTLIVGPVFPHEVVGFSGGNKYLFPGVSGQELIDVSHWLGALITSADIIGTRGDHAGACLDRRRGLAGARRSLRALPGRGRAAGLHAAAFGEPRSAWAAAAESRPRRTSATLTPPSGACCH